MAMLRPVSGWHVAEKFVLLGVLFEGVPTHLLHKDQHLPVAPVSVDDNQARGEHFFAQEDLLFGLSLILFQKHLNLAVEV